MGVELQEVSGAAGGTVSGHRYGNCRAPLKLEGHSWEVTVTKGRLDTCGGSLAAAITNPCNSLPGASMESWIRLPMCALRAVPMNGIKLLTSGWVVSLTPCSLQRVPGTRSESGLQLCTCITGHRR